MRSINVMVQYEPPMLMLPLLLAQTLSSPAVDQSTTAATRAQAWIAAAYPTVRTGDVGFRIATDGQRLHVEVLDEVARQLPGRREVVPALTVDLRYASDGALEEATARGPFVQSVALDALKKAVTAHPEWTDAQIDTAITNAGGQFGPTAAAKLATASPASALLRDASVTTSTFDARDARGPVWTSEVTSGTRTFQFAFEPISGRLVSITVK
jgi:hypothetical protein